MAAEYVVTLRVQTLGEAQELWEEAADLLGPRLLERTITRAEQDATEIGRAHV